MSGPLPHPTKVQEMLARYLDDAQTGVTSAMHASQSSNEFRHVFRVCLAADAVLAGLSVPAWKPSLSAPRSLVRRMPLLISLGQLGVATMEMRRFSELVFWALYFSEHPVEWSSFEKGPGKGFAKDIKTPIVYCAHRELAFYMNYAAERLEDEPSGIPRSSIGKLRQAQSKLNAVVHPAALAGQRSLSPVWDDVSPSNLTKFGLTLRAVLSNAVVVLAAFRTSAFDNMTAPRRAHFDWLVGTQLSKRVRGGPFGLRR